MDYQRIYNQIVTRAKNRKIQGYTERHHIIPKCMGGDNSKSNLVELTAREHFVCHKLLTFIYPKNQKLIYALWVMANGRFKQKSNPYKISSRDYEYSKKLFIKTQTGKKQSKKTIEKRKNTRKKLGDWSQFYTKDILEKMSESKKNRKVTWGDKISKGKKGKTRNITWGDKISQAKHGKPKTGKKILQIDPKTNEVIKVWASITEAVNTLDNKGIYNALIGISKTSNGFIWKYKK